jgi:hypothetical protein
MLDSQSYNVYSLSDVVYYYDDVPVFAGGC